MRRYASSWRGRGCGEPASEPVFGVMPASNARKKKHIYTGSGPSEKNIITT